MKPEKSLTEHKNEYHPHLWEKIFVYVTIILLLGVVSFILIRNDKINDPAYVVIIRTFLSVSMAVLGAIIPGLMKVDVSVKGCIIRATGAMALFALTYLITPGILSVRSDNHDTLKNVGIKMKAGTVEGDMTGFRGTNTGDLPDSTIVEQTVGEVKKGGKVLGIDLKKETTNE